MSLLSTTKTNGDKEMIAAAKSSLPYPVHREEAMDLLERREVNGSRCQDTEHFVTAEITSASAYNDEVVEMGSLGGLNTITTKKLQFEVAFVARIPLCPPSIVILVMAEEQHKTPVQQQCDDDEDDKLTERRRTVGDRTAK